MVYAEDLKKSDLIAQGVIEELIPSSPRDGHIKSPIILSRDHDDVSGTDSPFRETVNIYDGSLDKMLLVTALEELLGLHYIMEVVLDGVKSLMVDLV